MGIDNFMRPEVAEALIEPFAIAPSPNWVSPNSLLDSAPMAPPVVSDGSTASYYELPEGATELQHLISHKNMNAQVGEIFRECYRYGEASHCDMLRGAKKMRFYINAEIERLEKL